MAQDEALDYFESSLETLFGQHQCATGQAGQQCVLELSPTQILKYQIPNNEESSNNRLFAHYQWDAGVEMARLLHESVSSTVARSTISHIKVADRNVIELGAGTGLPGLTCALSGARKVMITDYPDPGILNAMQKNIDLCQVGHSATARGLAWGDDHTAEQILRDCSAQGFDLILCADVLWLSSAHAALLSTITKLARRNADDQVLILSGFHTGRRALTSFFRQALRAGLVVDVSADHEGIGEFNVITRTWRAWSGSFPFPGREGKQDGCINRDAIDIGEEEEDNMDDHTERTKWLLFVCLRWSDSHLQSRPH